MKKSNLSNASIVTILILSALVVSGCANMTNTQQRAATGTLGGAAGGAVIGAIAGNAGMGAAIGAGVGALGGFAYGKHEESVNKAYQQGKQDASQSK